MTTAPDDIRDRAEELAFNYVGMSEPELAEALAELLYMNTAKMARCLSFFASVIKCGEPWTETCQRKYDAAISPTTQQRQCQPGEDDMELALEKQKANRKLWVDALRSGKYQQATETLTSGGGYCCLGVACKVMGKSDREIAQHDNLAGLPEVRAFFGIVEPDGDYLIGDDNRCLAEDNDGGASFFEIADTIESEPDGLFA